MKRNIIPKDVATVITLSGFSAHLSIAPSSIRAEHILLRIVIYHLLNLKIPFRKAVQDNKACGPNWGIFKFWPAIWGETGRLLPHGCQAISSLDVSGYKAHESTGICACVFCEIVT